MAAHPPLRLSLLVSLFLAPILSGVVWWQGQQSRDEHIAHYLQAQDMRLNLRADLMLKEFEAGLERMQEIPRLLAHADELRKPLHSGAKAELLRATTYLQSISDLMDLDIAVLLNPQGEAVACTKAGLVGRNYAYRSYFKQALVGFPAQEFVIGAVTGEAGMMFAAPVSSDTGVQGVVGVKLASGKLARLVRDTQVFVVNDDGVVVLGNDDQILMSALHNGRVHQLSEKKRKERYQRTEFAQLPFEPLQSVSGFVLWRNTGDSAPHLMALRAQASGLYTLYYHVRLDDYQSIQDYGLRTQWLTTLLTLVLVVALSFALVYFGHNRAHERLLAERLRLATENTGVGIWEWDILQDCLYWNDQMYRLLDLPVGGGVCDYLTWRNSVHPDDVLRAEGNLQEVLRGDADEYRDDYRVIWSDGTIHYIEANARVMRDGKGRALKMLGTNLDVTQERNQAQALLEHRENLQALVAEQTKGILEAKRHAEAANQAKTEFLSNISHELRTPLHAMLGFANLGATRIDRLSKEKTATYFNQIRESGRRLLMLLDDLLDLSKLEAGKMVLTFKALRMDALLSAVKEEFMPLLESKRLEVDMVVLMSSPLLRGDSLRLTQVLRNLMSNAIKFSPEGREIRCIVQASMLAGLLPDAPDRPAMRITVSDQGIGIPEGELEKVFDKFVQSSKTRTGAGGTGLGLAICREIVEGHGGTITAHNNRNGGASFEVTLPLDQPEVEGHSV